MRHRDNQQEALGTIQQIRAVSELLKLTEKARSLLGGGEARARGEGVMEVRRSKFQEGRVMSQHRADGYKDEKKSAHWIWNPSTNW